MEEDSILYRELASGRYSFLEIGCGSGGSIDHCQRRFNALRGVGVDYTRAAIIAARAKGYTAYWCDVLHQPLPERSVRFISMMDTLEHLPATTDMAALLARFAAAAGDFLFIRHPSFEHQDIDYLATMGLKISWTDWSGHTNRLTIADFQRAFALNGWTEYVIVPNMPLYDSSAPPFVPIDSPTDTPFYDANAHGSKHIVRFGTPIIGKFDLFVCVNPDMPKSEWDWITDLRGWDAAWE